MSLTPQLVSLAQSSAGAPMVGYKLYSVQLPAMTTGSVAFTLAGTVFLPNMTEVVGFETITAGGTQGQPLIYQTGAQVSALVAGYSSVQLTCISSSATDTSTYRVYFQTPDGLVGTSNPVF
jgi:hypothetical protein